MALPEKINNRSDIKKGKYERYQKRVMHRHNRHKMKAEILRGEEPVSVDHKYFGWTT